MDRFKWVIVILGAIFLIILADKWVFQPESQRQEEMQKREECYKKINAIIMQKPSHMRDVPVSKIESVTALCMKGYQDMENLLK